MNFCIRNFIERFMCQSFPSHYKVVILIYYDQEQYKDPNYIAVHQCSIKYYIWQERLQYSSAVIFIPTKQEMERYSSRLGRIVIGKNIYQVHQNTLSGLILDKYVLPYVTVALLLRPHRVDWEVGYSHVWSLGANIMRHLGAHIQFGTSRERDKQIKQQLRSNWFVAIRWYMIEFRKRKSHYKYIQYNYNVPVYRVGGVFMYTKIAHHILPYIPNTPPDTFMYDPRLNIIFQCVKPCIDKIDAMQRMKSIIPHSRFVSTSVWRSFIDERLWPYPQIQPLSCITLMHVKSNGSEPLRCIYSCYCVCLVHNVYTVRFFFQSSKHSVTGGNVFFKRQLKKSNLNWNIKYF